MTAALTGNKAIQGPFGIEVGKDIRDAMMLFWYRLGGDLSPKEFGLLAARSVEDHILETG